MDYLVLASMWRHENDYALDFIKYHTSLGVEKFIIYDREYNDLKKILGSNPAVEIVHYPENARNLHQQAWADAIEKTKGKTKWLACIDADQALVPVKADDVREVLQDYEQFASLQCNWHSFGSNGALKKEAAPMYERFTMRGPANMAENRHTQTIVQPSKALPVKWRDPHHPILMYPEISVNTSKGKVFGPFNDPPVHDVMWIAHYITKSKEEWDFKRAKPRGDIYQVSRLPQADEDFRILDAVANAEKEERVLDLWRKANANV